MRRRLRESCFTSPGEQVVIPAGTTIERPAVGRSRKPRLRGGATYQLFGHSSSSCTLMSVMFATLQAGKKPPQTESSLRRKSLQRMVVACSACRIRLSRSSCQTLWSCREPGATTDAPTPRPAMKNLPAERLCGTEGCGPTRTTDTKFEINPEVTPVQVNVTLVRDSLPGFHLLGGSQ